jgi:hypothetical protein
MNKINSIAVFWGILDLLTIAWYLGCTIYRGDIPIVQDIVQATTTLKMFEFPASKFLSYLLVLLYISPILSGILLILKKKAGLIVSYIQTPFRLILIIPPSISFILWPINDSFSKIAVLSLGFTLVFLSETIRISTLIVWNKKRTT